MLALVMVGSALVMALGFGKLFHWDIGLTAGMLAGSMTSTPVLVGAGDTLRQTLANNPNLPHLQDNLSLGYALTYLIGLVSLILAHAIYRSFSTKTCQPRRSRSRVNAV